MTRKLIKGSYVSRRQSKPTASKSLRRIIPLQVGDVSPLSPGSSHLGTDVPTIVEPFPMKFLLITHVRGRIVMDAEALPTIIPIWLSHFDKIMPEPRSFPRFVPRLLGPRQHQPQRVEPTITFGEPFMFSEGILEGLREYRSRRPSASSCVPLGSSGRGMESTLGLFSARDEVPSGMMAHRLDEAGVLKLRSDITSELQGALGALGESVRA